MHDIQVGPLRIRFLVEDEALSMFECHVPPGGRVPAPHSHDAFVETIYGLEGTTRFTVDGVTSELGPGDAVVVPRGAVHGFEVGGRARPSSPWRSPAPSARRTSPISPT